MHAIALETSGRIGSVALVKDSRVIEERTFPHGLKHAAGVVVLIDDILKSHSLTPKDLQQIYISNGPGSFTGLRIAVTLAKSMALATGIQIVAVPSVRVLVENAPAEAKNAIIVLDAKRDQIFTARFERASSGEWLEREPAHVDSLTAMIERSPRPLQLLGEGIPYHQKFIPQNDPTIIVTPEDSWRARASIVAKIGSEMATRGAFVDPFTLIPIYIRKPEAEEKLESAQKPVY